MVTGFPSLPASSRIRRSSTEPAPWLRRLEALLPHHPIATPQTLTDRAAVRYALCWRPGPGVLADLPNLKAIFSLGAGVDHLLDEIGRAHV